MQKTITITPSWQIHIPLQIRERLGLTKPVKARINIEQGRMIITPEKSALLSFAGKFKKHYKKKIDLEKTRDYIDYSRL